LATPDSDSAQKPASLTTRAIRGAFWTSSPFLLQMGVRLVFFSDQGAAAMGLFDVALLLVMFLALLSDLGLWSALIQHRNVTDLHFSTAFWTCLCSGIVIAALTSRFGPQAIESLRLGIGNLLAVVGMGGSAGPAAHAGTSEHAPILATMSLLLPCAAVSGLFRARLQRDLRFKRIAFAEVGSVLVYSAFTLAMLESLGIMSLVIGAVVREAALLVGLAITSCWLPKLTFSGTALRQILSFGLNFTGSRAVNYANSALPALVVFSALGKEALGYYSFAVALTLMPLTRISTILTRVFFPAFSTVQEDDAMLRRGYLKTAQSIAMFYWPALVAIFVFAPDGIELMRGVKDHDYSPALLPLRLLVVATMLKAVGTGVGSMFLAKGKAHWALYWSLFSMGVLLPLLLWSIQDHLIGVGVVMAATSFIFLVLSQLLTNRLISLRSTEYLGTLIRPALVTGFVLLSTTLLRPFLPGDTLAVCLQAVVASALVGGLALRLFAWDLCWSLWRSLRGQTNPVGAESTPTPDDNIR
jgi:O-antigen/teichoic acid export membrane protein